ncbi:hypothetical protein HYC85_029143 [Camellia sinensis]|uniref:Uncharacterized protein n=1 Tax=Camellia sinensis TaxID=4442 RepID=A0A7J7FX94_CAMSI|nr:hypothetical protein HYC85_029143 [Camellia sinensis]
MQWIYYCFDILRIGLGFITNLVVIPQLSLFPRMNHNHKTFNQFRVFVLDKYPEPANSSEGVLTYLPSSSSRDEGHCIASEFRTTDLLKQQILELETGETTATMEMMVETRLESEAWATRMGKHVMQMNKHLQSGKRKIANVVEQGKEHHHHPRATRFLTGFLVKKNSPLIPNFPFHQI